MQSWYILSPQSSNPVLRMVNETEMDVKELKVEVL